MNFFKTEIYNGLYGTSSHSHSFFLLLTLKWQMTVQSMRCMAIKWERTKSESWLFCRLSCDLHMSHKHLMDSIKCTPEESMQPHKRTGNDQGSRASAGPPQCQPPSFQRVTPAGVESAYRSNAQHSGHYHLPCALGLFLTPSTEWKLCVAGAQSWYFLPR